MSKENFGRLASLVAACALLIDYILTVAVSHLVGRRADRRGPARASATSQVRDRGRGHPAGDPRQPPRPARVGQHLRHPDLPVRGRGAADDRDGRPGRSSSAARASRRRARRRGASRPRRAVAMLLLLLRAFAVGSVALTGVEAIANGVPAFKPPESQNAATHADRDGGPAGRPVRGHHVPGQTASASCPTTRPTVIAQVAAHVFGDGVDGLLPVPVLHRRSSSSWPPTPRSTPFRGWPRILATDGFIPRQFGLRGDRLAFTPAS